MKTINFQEQPEIGSLLLHGLNNLGKTHIVGSMLEYEQQFGRCLYAGMAGEPNATLRQYDLGEVKIVEFETVDEIAEAVRKMASPFRAIAIDSLQRLAEMGNAKVTDGKHIVGAKEDHGREWAKLKYEIFKHLMLLAGKCELIVATCPSRHHENAVSHEVRVVPDVPGVGETIQGRFNFVGYLESTSVSAGRADRTVSFHRRLDAVTRWNAPNPITKPLAIPQGKQVWSTIRATLENGLNYDPGETDYRSQARNIGFQTLQVDSDSTLTEGADNNPSA